MGCLFSKIISLPEETEGEEEEGERKQAKKWAQ